MTHIPEIQVSALLDGELGREETLAVVDQLLESPALQRFYRAGRRLDVALGELRGGDAEGAPPSELWSRIAAAATLPDRGKAAASRPRPPVWRWALQAAAVVLVAVATWLLAPSAQRPGGPLDLAGSDVVSVALASEPDRMTERRFLEITTELLRADRSFHRQMYQILQAVHRPSLEGSAEGPLPLVDDGPALRRARADDPAGGTRTWD